MTLHLSNVEIDNLEKKKRDTWKIIHANSSYLHEVEGIPYEEIIKIVRKIKRADKLLEKEIAEIDTEIKRLQQYCTHEWVDQDPEGRRNFDMYQCKKCGAWK